MNLVTPNTPTPTPGTVLHLLYVAKDGRLSERLVRIYAASPTLWEGIDLIKAEPRRFRREQLFWAKSISDPEERHDVFFRLTVRREFEKAMAQKGKEE
jgi:hypothetical protein